MSVGTARRNQRCMKPTNSANRAPNPNRRVAWNHVRGIVTYLHWAGLIRPCCTEVSKCDDEPELSLIDQRLQICIARDHQDLDSLT